MIRFLTEISVLEIDVFFKYYRNKRHIYEEGLWVARIISEAHYNELKSYRMHNLKNLIETF